MPGDGCCCCQSMQSEIMRVKTTTIPAFNFDTILYHTGHESQMGMRDASNIAGYSMSKIRAINTWWAARRGLFARDSSRAGGLIERFCTMMYLRPTLIVYKYKLQIATLPRPKCDLYFTILIVHKQKPQIHLMEVIHKTQFAQFEKDFSKLPVFLQKKFEEAVVASSKKSDADRVANKLEKAEKNLNEQK